MPHNDMIRVIELDHHCTGPGVALQDGRVDGVVSASARLGGAPDVPTRPRPVSRGAHTIPLPSRLAIDSALRCKLQAVKADRLGDHAGGVDCLLSSCILDRHTLACLSAAGPIELIEVVEGEEGPIKHDRLAAKTI